MTANLIPFYYTIGFAVILVALVPRREIRRLAIYGMIFGGLADILVVSFAHYIGEFRYINYEPFGLFGIHFMAPIAWTVFFMLYFYFLPSGTVYRYIYTVMGMLYSMMFCQTITKLGILSLANGLVDSIVPFVPWYLAATWGYSKLTEQERTAERRPQHSGTLAILQPAAKPLPPERNKKPDGSNT